MKQTGVISTDMIETKVMALLKSEPRSNKDLREALGLSTVRYDQRLDRALQRMRKAGKLKLIGSRWTVEETAICESCGGKGWVRH